jgi:mRNA interferase RelE/StbE
MAYTLSILRRTQKEIADLPAHVRTQIRAGIAALMDDPRPPGCRKLTGREGWRIRVGDYRVIYEVDDASLSITVLHVGHRRDVYR